MRQALSMMRNIVYKVAGLRPECFGEYNRISPSARAENDCETCTALSECSKHWPLKGAARS